MSDSDSQNVSDRKYANEVEFWSSAASSNDTGDQEAKTSSAGAGGSARVDHLEAESQALALAIAEEADASG